MLQVESGGHLDHLIFTERGGVLQKNRSFQNDNSGGFVTAKIKFPKREPDFGVSNLSITAFGTSHSGKCHFTV